MATAKQKPQKASQSRAQKAARSPRKTAPATPRYSEQYERAVKEFERGVQLFNSKSFSEARQVFESVIEQFADEVEICDRSRHYISACSKRLESNDFKPASLEDHFHLGVFHLNRGEWSRALKEFESALAQDPSSDLVHYGIASAHAVGGDKNKAIASLQEAIRRNEKNRIHAQNDPDFDTLRDEDTFIQLVEPEGSVGR